MRDKRSPFYKTKLHCHKASKRTSDFPKDEDSITSSAVDEHSVSSTTHATASEAHPESNKIKQ